MNKNTEKVFIIVAAVIMTGENGLHFLSVYDAQEVARYKQVPTTISIQPVDIEKCRLDNKNICVSTTGLSQATLGNIYNR
ncbi:MAG TPA: hypothetical protein VMV71_04200 [Candidatus Paceibacterota bacterium]|nr:hypothetical protein [Candidatus Paceibacterota bacterium]